MDPPPPDPLDPEYPAWLRRRIAELLKSERLEQRSSALALAGRLGKKISDQSILNNESGARCPGLDSLVIHCQSLTLDFVDFINRTRQ